MNKLYAGIGSRIVPYEIGEQMVHFAITMAHYGIVLRSGAADGADKAFERGCDVAEGNKEIYLPWKDFDNHPSPYFHIPDLAYAVAENYYKFGNWDQLKDTTKRFMARDCQQVGGVYIDTMVDFVVCYTRDGVEHDDDRTRITGGTGQAISFASLNGIPVFNLYNEGRYDELQAFIKEMY